MLAGRADAPDATLLRALAASQLDAATRPTISFLHVSAAGGTSLCLTARSNSLSVPTRADGRWNNCWDRALRDAVGDRGRPHAGAGGGSSAGQEAEKEEGARGAVRTGGVR